ncbi:hypothetical protein [Vibrio olivae]|uniref:Uncharacterized protein n=1 Tax=Vibrio olivae TaxID=1243002 RepID=A0ABV5HR50_9VIBR
MNMKIHKFNTYIPLVLIILGWHWYLFPSRSGDDLGLGTFFIEAYVIAPLATIWGFSYSIIRKLWVWISIFTAIGIIPELVFFLKPEWLF